MRLTKSVCQQLLDQNDGFEIETHYSGRNFSEYRKYSISGGKLYIRKTGKTSWADSRFKENAVADDDQTKRFLRKYLNTLNTDGIE